MIDVLKNPPFGFEEVTKNHFFYKKNDILKTCDKWIEEAKNSDDSNYSGLVYSHNVNLATKFKIKNDYLKALEEEVKELKFLLNDLRL